MTVFRVVLGVLQVALAFVFIAVATHAREDAGPPPPARVIEGMAWTLSSVLLLGGVLLMATP